jgi:hypothetical protein
MPIHCSLSPLFLRMLLVCRGLQAQRFLGVGFEHADRSGHASDLIGQILVGDVTFQIPLGEGNHAGFQTP